MMVKLNGQIFWLEMMNFWKKYNNIWNKVSNSIKKVLNCKPIYNEKILKTKIRPCNDKAAGFYTRKIPEANF